jgi:NAD(P)-dependent dehydrogenase (short-subunit alcohol dehydrogenase family)
VAIGRPAVQGFDFSGKRVLVSGATSGIGRATALAFAAAGARVVLSGRDAERASTVVAEIAAAGGAAYFVAADLAEDGAAARMVAEAVETLGGLDAAINNAGYQEPPAMLAEQPDAAYERVFAVNVRAVFQAMKAELAAMLPASDSPGEGPGAGSIVNVASVSGVRNANPGFALYSSAKAAVVHMTRAAAMEYGPRGIRINAVSPGRIVTPMMLGSGLDPDRVGQSLPLRRMGTAEEVAAALLWLVSDAAGFVTGQNLGVDGGFLAT